MLQPSSSLEFNYSLYYFVLFAVVIHISCVIPRNFSFTYSIPVLPYLHRVVFEKFTTPLFIYHHVPLYLQRVVLNLTAPFFYIKPISIELAEPCCIEIYFSLAYIPPCSIIFAKACCIEVYFTTAYIPPASVILAEPCCIEIYLTTAHIPPASVILAKTGCIEVYFATAYIPPASGIFT